MKPLLILGGVALILMSLAGLLMLYRTFMSLNRMIEKAKESYQQAVNRDINIATNDDVEKLGFYFSGLLNELHTKVEEAGKYAAELADVNKRLANMATKDGLTGLYNHHYIKERMNNEVQRAITFKRNLSVVMLDIDNFKQFNDTYGHLSGDRVLQDISNIISMKIRLIDVPARYGGEEFIIIMPEINKEEAMETAENIRRNIADHKFSHQDNPELSNITVSVGVCDCQDIKMSASELIHSADQALYQAKRNGKNQVVFSKI